MSYAEARKKYQTLGIDTDRAIEKAKEISISVHAWTLDDVAGFEKTDAALSGSGVMPVGNFPGKAKNIDQFRKDLDMVLKLVPGKKSVGLQTNEGDYKGKLKEKTDIDRSHFDSWIDWAKEREVGLDINPAIYSHPMASSGYTLASRDKNVREYWIEYVKKIREIADYTGKSLKKPSISNLWIIDGSKDITPLRFEHRTLLEDSLDKIYAKKYKIENVVDSVECKLFGIGSEFYNTGSLEFYLLYAKKQNIGITLDTGHFHPTEQVSDKISSIINFLPAVVLHLSRGIRWDSDHVVILSDELLAIMLEIKRADCFSKIYIGTDYFDSSINRVGALAAGARAVSKGLLFALLEPTGLLKEAEDSGDNFRRLALLEDIKVLPFGDVWEEYCSRWGTPGDFKWIDAAGKYFRDEASKR